MGAYAALGVDAVQYASLTGSEDGVYDEAVEMRFGRASEDGGSHEGVDYDVDPPPDGASCA